MSNYNFIDLYNNFILLDNNTQIIYIFILIILLFIINNVIKISNELFKSLIITFVIFIIFISQKNKNVSKDVKSINKINSSLNLKNYKYILANLDVSSIYFELIELRHINKYSFMSSLIDTNIYLQIYSDIKNKNSNYAQLLDIAMEKKDSALNHLLSIIYSISPNTGINNEDYSIIKNPIENILYTKVSELKSIFDNYWFEMLDISRTIYETTDININSKPIEFDNNSPNPNAKLDIFDIFYGNIEP